MMRILSEKAAKPTEQLGPQVVRGLQSERIKRQRYGMYAARSRPSTFPFRDGAPAI